MKPNQRNRFNNRHVGSRNTRPLIIYRNTALESTGPCGKLRGTALQLYEKYTSAGKDALIQNDDILAENCFQYADHYMHIQNQAIANEQALHAQQQARAMAIAEQREAEEEPSVEGELKVVDLSVAAEAPVQEQNGAESVVEEPKPRRKLRLTKKVDTSPAET